MTSDEVEAKVATPPRWALQNWIGFERFDRDWEMFDPYVDEERVGASLSDDLLDVHHDVARGLVLWDGDLHARNPDLEP
jgi:hypothetical protein